jgi:hypothetical protein
VQHQTPSTYRSRSDTWLGKDRGVNQPVGLFPVLVPWGTAPCKTCSQLLQIAQPPKMHVFVSGVLELKSNTSAFTSICGHSWSLPDIRRISLLGSEILPQSIEYPISQCPGKTAFVVKYFLWRCLPLSTGYRPKLLYLLHLTTKTMIQVLLNLGVFPHRKPKECRPLSRMRDMGVKQGSPTCSPADSSKSNLTWRAIDSTPRNSA